MTLVHSQFRLAPEALGELAATAAAAGHSRSEALRSAVSLYVAFHGASAYKQRRVRELLGYEQPAVDVHECPCGIAAGICSLHGFCPAAAGTGPCRCNTAQQNGRQNRSDAEDPF